jgi:hypothetical protein
VTRESGSYGAVPSSGQDGVPATGSADGEASAPLRPELAAELLGALDKAVRARRLYRENNPVYAGFVSALRGSVERLWEHAAELTVGVEEQAFRWEERRFAFGGGRESLAQIFYKDGVRQLTFLPGFEEEIELLLGVLQQVRLLDQDSGEDLVTLLWAQEFTAFQYSYVDALADGLDLPTPPPVGVGGRIDRAALRRDSESPSDAPSPAVQRGEPPVASITRADFDATIYFLDAGELERLHVEVEREWSRPLRSDALAALFDRLEDPLPARQLEIIAILRQLLSVFLTQADLHSASRVLIELNALLAAGRLDAAGRQEAEALFRDLSDPALLGAFFSSLAALPDGGDAELAVFLQHLGRGALPLLLRTSEALEEATLRERLAAAIERLAAQHPAELLAALDDADLLVAAGAARLCGRLALPRGWVAARAAPVPPPPPPPPPPAAGVVRLLERTDPAVRLTAVAALARIRTSIAMEGVLRALGDDDREIRLLAARAIADARYTPGRRWLDQALNSEAVRTADVTERIALYEAFGAVADADIISRLDRMLNGRRLFGKEAPELRACAALALGRAGTPEAIASLRRAVEETNPIVRSAVTRALRLQSAEP